VQPTPVLVYSGGRNGGQTIIGARDANGDLILRSTSNVTKGQVLVDETTDSTTTSEGAFAVSGGVGIIKNLNVGGTTSSQGLCEPITYQSSTILLTKNDFTVLADTASESFEVDLPASPKDGHIINIKKIAAANVLTVGRNGKNIDGAASNLTLTNNGESVTLQYNSSLGWYTLQRGFSGYSGVNGTVGVSGYSGQNGNVGTSGYSGATGTGTSGYSGISVYSRQTEIDFGATPVDTTTFIITDVNVTTSSIITGQMAYVAPTDKDLDELEFDSFDLRFAAGSGQFTLVARSLEGLVADKFKINYSYSVS
jgi:hypothetical protein